LPEEKGQSPVKEYRLIPVEEDTNGDNAVNLIDLIRLMRDNKALIRKITGFFLLIGIVLALFSPVEYTSEALLLPEMKESESSAGDMLESYGGLLGLGGMGSMDLSQEGKIAPDVYPKIVESLGFQHKLLQQDYYFASRDTTVSGYTYFKEVRDLSLLEWLAEYTIKLPGKIGSSKPRDTLPQWLRDIFDEEEVLELTDDELEVIEDMRERIEIELDSQTGVLTTTAKMPNALVSAQVNREVINRLKKFVEEYSTQKAKEDLAFAETQHQQAQERLKEVQDELATFLDQNVNLSTAKSRTQEQRLQAEFDLAYEMYNNVSQQLMEAKMKVQEQTPVFKVIQSVNVPNSKSEPQRILIIVLSIISGLIVSFLYIAGRSIYDNVRSQL
jgi:uncharacterized protein involved in exopolysaccharide biosynthesis